jgi:hypothetical protein
VRLPSALDIDGAAETGTELRVTCPEPGILEALCIQWIRYDAAPPAFDSDISASPYTKVIPGASAALYTIGPDDVGKRIGVVVRAAGSSFTRWVIMPGVVKQLASTVEVRVRVMPHEHSKYCDRRVRVCTAAGRYREGATLRAEVTGLPPELASQYGVVWYRSTTTDPRALQSRRPPALSLAPEGGSSSARGLQQVPPMSPLASPLPAAPLTQRDTESPRPGGLMSQAWSILSGSNRRNMVRSQSMGSEPGGSTPSAVASAAPAAGAVIHRGSLSSAGSSAALAGITYVRVRQRGASELPPAPPDHQSSTPLPALKARLAELAARSAALAAHGNSPLPPPRPLPPPGAPLDELEYALFAEDVDRLICCALVKLDEPGDIPVTIQPHGPAPSKPRAQTAPTLSEDPLVPPGKTFQETQREWFAFKPTVASSPVGSARGRLDSEPSAAVDLGSPAVRPLSGATHRSFRDLQREWFLQPPESESSARRKVSESSAESPSRRKASESAAELPVGVAANDPVVPFAGLSATASASSARAPTEHIDERWGDSPEKSSPAAAAVASAGGDSSRVTSVPSPRAEPVSAALQQLVPSNSSSGPALAVEPLRSDMRLSVSVGPIEAAPPRAREVWIEGVPSVGCLLTGHVYYYGGMEVRRCHLTLPAPLPASLLVPSAPLLCFFLHSPLLLHGIFQGASEACWVAITESGDTVELKRPRVSEPSTLPDLDAPIGEKFTGA